MTTIPDNLRALAEACRDVEWTTDVWIDSNSYGWRATGPNRESGRNDDNAEPGCPDEQAAQRDAAYIAAASPSVVLAMLDEIDRLRKDAQSAHLETITAIGEAGELQQQLAAVTAERDSFQTALIEALLAWEQRIDQCDYPDNDAAKQERKRIAELFNAGTVSTARKAGSHE